MVHTLRLDNYSPTPRKLVLGTNSSYGTESIKIERGAGWDGLNLTATWHIPGREEPLRVALLDGDAMDVPPEVTKEAKDGVLVLAGLASGVQRARSTSTSTTMRAGRGGTARLTFLWLYLNTGAG